MSLDLYNYEYFHRADGIRSWNSKTLKFGDAMAALCYAFGISWQDLQQGFPEVFAEDDRTGRVERHSDKLTQQLDFIKQNKSRTPKRVLEIGGGRGEVAQVLRYLGVDVVSIEPGAGADKWYQETAEKFFGSEFDAALPDNRYLQDAVADLDFSTFDTILMVESLEHILEEQFDPVWQQIVDKFHGLFVVVNWVNYHPIAVGQFASAAEHCRLVDDVLYEKWISQSKQCVWRNGSHLVLDF